MGEYPLKIQDNSIPFKGPMKNENDTYYFIQYENNKKCGIGIMLWEDGSFYSG